MFWVQKKISFIFCVFKVLQCISISNGFVSSKIYDKRDEFDFDILNVLFWMVTFHVATLIRVYILDGDVPRRPSYKSVYEFRSNQLK